MRVANVVLLIVGVSVGAAGCGIATTAGAEYEPDLDFGAYSSFTWEEEAIGRTGDVRLENNPFFEDRLFEAVERELSARGIRRDDSAPDLLVHYHLSVRDHIEVYQADPTSGYPTTDFGTSTDVVQYEEGTFILHFVNRETSENLWIGWARGNIGPALRDSERMREWVDDATARIFEDFPVLGRGR